MDDPERFELTDLEKWILKQRSLGFTLRELAESRGRSRHTLRHQMTIICQKLHVKNGTAAIALALREGLID